NTFLSLEILTVALPVPFTIGQPSCHSTGNKIDSRPNNVKCFCGLVARATSHQSPYSSSIKSACPTDCNGNFTSLLDRIGLFGHGLNGPQIFLLLCMVTMCPSLVPPSARIK